MNNTDMFYEPVDLPNWQELNDQEILDASKKFLDRVKTRHSIRDFSRRKVPHEIIENCIMAASTAPNSANHQPWHFVAVSNRELKHKIRLDVEATIEKDFDADHRDWRRDLLPIGSTSAKDHLDGAPWLIVVFAKHKREAENGELLDNLFVNKGVGIATGLLVTALHEAGLATLVHRAGSKEFLNEMLDRPDYEEPFLMVAVGHPAVYATIPQMAKQKKPLDEILTFRD